MSKYNKCPHIPFPCAFPLPEIGPTGPPGPVPQSGFKAVNANIDQIAPANTLIFPVQYPDEIFDLNNEYDPIKSTFIPKQDGVYSINASLNFGSEVNGEIVITNFSVLIVIRVNGEPVVVDNDFMGEVPIINVVSVSAILQLTAGDEVNIAVTSTTAGVIISNSLSMRFEAVRLPSPLINNSLSSHITSHSNIFSNGTINRY
ncbi:hypothetical protein [Bacillus sp. SBS7]|uniref:hypothetical protein n=1 Tax=Bacillus sp. SBS7 TaxID=3401756 RepID=UPI003AA9B66C